MCFGISARFSLYQFVSSQPYIPLVETINFKKDFGLKQHSFIERILFLGNEKWYVLESKEVVEIGAPCLS